MSRPLVYGLTFSFTNDVYSPPYGTYQDEKTFEEYLVPSSETINGMAFGKNENREFCSVALVTDE
jgi:hypothetical protein